ncbi:MAG: DUF721 domain-containing protein [Acidisphaera sp.]|nr:DUF721 domain-containing protein [Acidisphaera sp.]
MTERRGGPTVPAAKPGPARDEVARHVYGPRPVAAVLPAVLRPAFRRRAPAAAQVLADWETIVGPTLAAVAVPRRLAAGTLTIGCAGPVALELQHLADALIGRINTHLGRHLVQRLRFVQEAPTPAGKPVSARAPRPEVAQAAEDRVSGLPQGELRDALAALGRAVLTRG